MKHRKWVLVLFAIFFLGIAGGYVTSRWARINDRFKQLILTQIAPYVDPESSIGSARIDLASLHLKDVHLTARSKSFSVEIEDLRLQYSMANLIRYGFSPGRVAREVLLVHPRLVVREMPASFKQDSLQSSPDQFRHILESFSGIHRITVDQGEILLENRKQAQIRLAHGLSGWFLASPADSASLRFTGNIFESEEDNLEINGVFDLTSGRPIAVDAMLNESRPSPELPLFLPAFIRVTDGRMRGEGHYRRGLGATGFFELIDGVFALQESALQYRDISLRADLSGRNVKIQGRIGDFNGCAVALTGAVQNILDPILTARAECDSLDLFTFLRRAAPDLRFPVTGLARFYLSLEGTPDSLVCAGQAGSDYFNISGIHFQRMTMNVRIAGRSLSFQGQAVQKEGATFNLRSFFDLSDFKDPTLRADMTINGPFHPLLTGRFNLNVRKLEGQLTARVGGRLSNPSGRIMGQLTLNSQDSRQIRLEPSFVYENHRCEGEILSSDLFRVTGKAERILTQDFQWQVNLFHFENLLAYLTDENVQNILEGIEASASLSADRKTWRTSIRANRIRFPGKEPLLNVMAEASRSASFQEGHFRAAWYGSASDSLRLTSQFHVEDDMLAIKNLRVEDMVKAEMTLPLRGDGAVLGTLNLHSVALSRLHPFFSQLQALEGVLNGDIWIQGKFKTPQISARLRLSDGRIFGDGTFEGDLSGRWEGQGIQSLTCQLNRNDIPILTGQVSLAAGDSLKGRFEGRDIFLGPDQIHFSSTGDQIRGAATFDFRVKGTTQNPLINGRLSISDGAFGAFTFQDFETQIQDAPDTSGSRTFFIRDGILRRPDGFVLTVNGRIPHPADQDADLHFQAQGNVLGPLSSFTSLTSQSQGKGTFNLRLGGRPGAWVPGEGDLTISSGSLDMTVLVKSLKNLRAHIVLEPESQFVRIDSLTALVDGYPIHVSNVPSLNGFAPFTIDTLGLDFGILQIRMENRGFPVHIPGVMESGDKGFIHLTGSKTGQPFLIAGPSSNPVFTGALLLSDSRVTYPFLPLKSDKNPSSAVDVLKKIDWNVRLEPYKDVHYVRNIESPLGNVFLDLKLRERFGDLNFEGILDDDTFQVWGRLSSTEGTLEAINQYFRPEQITFDFPKGAGYPILRGRAFTTVIDSLGAPSTVWITLTNLDATPGSEGQGGYLDKIVFRFETDNPNLGRNEADLLAALGYSESQMKDRAYDAIGLQVENWVFRPLFRPIENQIRRRLGLDVVRVSSMFSRNLMRLQAMEGQNQPLDPKWLLRSTRLTLGKYLAPGFFLIYSGQVQNDMDIQYRLNGLGVRHAISLEYSIRPDLFLEMEYTYDSQLLSDRREDKKIWLRHIFPF